MPASDVTVSATFAPRQEVTVRFNTGESSITCYAGDTITLPEFTGAVPTGYKFVGWAGQEVDKATDKPESLAAGATYTMPETDKILYALFSHTEGGTGSSDVYELTDELVPGDYVIGAIVGTAGADNVIAAMNMEVTGGWLKYQKVTPVSEKITMTDKAYVWTLAKMDTGFSLYNNSSKQYLKLTNKTGSGSIVLLDDATAIYTSVANAAQKVFEVHSDATATADNGNQLACNFTSNMGYRMYAHRGHQVDDGGISTQIRFFRQSGGGTTYYTTSPDTTTYTLTGIEITTMPTKTTFVVNEAFSSEGLVVTATYAAEKDPTKTKTVDVTSKVNITGGDTSTAVTRTVSVSYTEGETTKTATYEITVKAAYTLTYDKNTTDDVTGMPENVTGLEDNTEYSLSPATPVRANYNFLGWAMSEDSNEKVTTVTMTGNQTVYAIWQEKTKYTVSFYAKQGAEPTKKEYHDGDTIAAADVPAIDPIEGYAFKGWYGDIYEGTTAPTYANPVGLEVTGNLTFYAVYAETSSTGGSTEYTLTDVSKIGTNDSVVVTILKDGTYYALPTAGATSSGPLANSTVTVSGNKITSTVDDTITWKIDYSETDKTFTLSTEADNTKKLNLTSNNNGVRVSKNSSTFTVAENGYLSGKDTSNTVRYIGIYNTNDWRCYEKINDNIAGQTLGFYVKAGEIISGYTTNPVSTKITVTWMNGTTVHEKMRVMYGVTITAPETKPEKAATEEKYYEFVGWAAEADGAVLSDFGTASATDGNKTFYAVFEEKAKLVATWNNYDGATLATKHYMPGETPAYPGSTDPTRAADAEYYYTFAGWEPDLLPIAKDTTYVAKYEAHARFEASLTLNRNTVKVDRNAQATGKLTDAGKATTQYTPVYSSLNETVATIDAATGRITTLAVGTVTIQVTYTVEGKEYTATQELNVVEGQTVAGYRLVTENLDDWSGDYVIMGKKNGAFDQAAVNNFFVLVPLYKAGEAPTFATNFTNAAPVELDENGTGTFALRSGGGFAASAIADNSISMASDDFYYTGKEKGTTLSGYNVITAISDEVVFTIECIDDVKGIYTIRVKGSNLYLAAPAKGANGTDNNRLYFSLESSELAQWYIRMETIQTNYTYDNPIVRISSAVPGNPYSLFFNGNNNGQFRDYTATSTDANIGYKDNTQTENGFGNYSLYLFGNPNPYKAQIYYLGDQVTIASPATVPSGAASAKLMSAIVPEIEDDSGWVQVGTPVWSIVEQSSGAVMSIDATTGVLSTNNAAAGSYALVQVTYGLRDTASNTDHTVTTQAKAVIGETASYTHVIYENKSGMGTEVQYNVYKNANQTAGCALPLDVYVVNNLTGASSKDGAVTVGGTAAWTVENTTDASEKATISADGKLDYSKITKNSILLVTVNGLTGAAGEGAATAAKAGTFKVYVRVVSYTSEITHGGETGNFTVPFGATSIVLDKLVKNADGNTAGVDTFTLTETGAYKWEATHGTITANDDGTAKLDVSGLEAGTVITVKVSGLEAKVGDAVTEVPHATVRVTVGDRPQNVTAENITVVIDYDRKVTIDLSGKFTVTNTELDTITLSEGAEDAGFALAKVDDKWTVTFTPQGILSEAKSCTYTVTAKDGSQAAGTITVQPASAVYYEDDNSAFTFTDGKHGKWATAMDGTTIDAQTSSLLSEDIIGYDENYDVKTYAKYSAGSVHYVNVTEDEIEGATEDMPKNPTVEFDFAGTGFDVISVTSNNTGAFLIEVTNAAKEIVFTKLLSTYRGYEYVPDGYVRTDYIPVIRCDENGTEDPAGQYSKTVTGENKFTVRFEPDGFFVKTTDGYKPEGEGESIDQKWYAKREMTTQWRPVDDGENLDYYQIPVIRKLGLPYGVYHVKITAAYSRVFDVRQDGEYNFYFDAVRIYDPIQSEQGQYHYVSLRDAIIAAGTFGVTKYEDCGHKDEQGNSIADWEVSIPAGYSDNSTLNGRGLLTRTCSICGHPIDYAYFYVNATVAETALATDAEPSSAVLNYTISVESDAPEGAREYIVELEDELQHRIPPDVDPDWVAHWAAANEDVILCVGNTAYARGAGKTYVTLDLCGGRYASGIRTETITVTGPRANLIQYAVHLEGHDGESGEFHEEDVILSRQVVPANQTRALLDPNKMFAYKYRMAETNLYHSLTEFIGWTEAPVSPRAFVSNAPKYYAVGEQYAPTGDITLYTLYHIRQTENTYVQTNTVPSSGKVILTRQDTSISGDVAYVTLTGSIKGDYCVNYVNKTYALPINDNMQSWQIKQLTEGETTGIYLTTTSHGMYLRIDDAAGMELTNVPDNAILELVRDEENNCFYLHSKQTGKWLQWRGTETAAVDSKEEATKLQLWRVGDNHETESYATMLHEFTDQSINQSNFDNESCWNYRITVCWCGQGDTYVKTSDAHNFTYVEISDTQHMASCPVCGLVKLEDHEFDATNTCTKCGYRKSEYTVSFVVYSEDVPGYGDMTGTVLEDTVTKGESYTIPTEEANADLYKFIKEEFVANDIHNPELIGWTTTKTSAKNLTQTAPNYYVPGASFTPTENTVLYPLFKFNCTCNSYVKTATVPTDSSTKVILSVKTLDENSSHFNYLPKTMCKTMSLYLPTDHRAKFEHALPFVEKETYWTIADVQTADGTAKALLSADENYYLRFDDTELSLGTDLTNATVEFLSDGNGAFYIHSVQNDKWLACNATANGTPRKILAPFHPVATQAEATPIVLFVKEAQAPETITTYATTPHEQTYGGQSQNDEAEKCSSVSSVVTICWCGEAAITPSTPETLDPTYIYITVALDAERHASVCEYCSDINKDTIQNHTFGEDGACTKCDYQSTSVDETTSTSAISPATSETAVAGVAIYAEGDADTGDSGNTGDTDTGNTGDTDTGDTGNTVNTIIGSGIIDGKGWLFNMEDFKKHGPKTEVYLAPEQAVVFYLTGGVDGTDVQLGAKAVNGTPAGLTVITLTGGTNGAVKTIEDKRLVTATEMYYEIGGDLVWNNGTSCVVIVMNTGEGVLALTDVRSTAELDVVMNKEATESGQAVLQRIAAGTMVYGPDDFITVVDSSKFPVNPDPVNPNPDPVNPNPDPVNPNPDPIDPNPDPIDPNPSDPKPGDPSDPKPETPSVTDFADLDKDAWYYDGVRYAVEAGLMNGTGAKTFEPDGKLTRAMLVTILYRLAGAPEVKATAKFTDVPADAWYAKAVAWAAEQKITNGTTDTTFDPNGNVTREQLVTLLWRYAGEPKTEGKLDAFPDAAKVAPYAQTAFAWAVENGVVKGDLVGKTGYLAPQGEATRAQIAAIFMRSEKLLAKD